MATDPTQRPQAEHGTLLAVTEHKRRGEKLCADCFNAANREARQAALHARHADPADVEEFISRAERLMDLRGLTVPRLASALRVHHRTLAGLLSGDKVPYKPTITRALEHLTELENTPPGDTVPAERAAKVREDHNRRAYESWRQRRQDRMRVRGEPAPELVAS